METEPRVDSVDQGKHDAGRDRWMVVDDNEGVAEFLAALLENIGVAHVQRFHSAEKALARFSAYPDRFQFVITGLDLPGMDGIALCKRLHEISPALKVVLTVGDSRISEEQAREMGFCGLLAKPFLVAQVCRLIEGFGMVPPSIFPNNNAPGKNNSAA